jgi:hypothetical protein
MADLTSIEKRKLERLFGMGGGYVLDFSNRTFAEFVEENAGRDIYDSGYDHGSGSKANRLRAFWAVEGNHLVGKLINALIEYGRDINAFQNDGTLADDCLRIVARLKQGSLVAELDALSATGDERDFETVATQVREVIEKNQPKAGLDRLHTFVIKFVRTLCEGRGITVTREKALHSLFGEYVKWLREDGHLDSEMTARILKSSISVLEAFNDVRNNQSLAHDNPVLNYDESLLIFNHVASSVRFIRVVEQRIKRAKPPEARKPVLYPLLASRAACTTGPGQLRGGTISGRVSTNEPLSSPPARFPRLYSGEKARISGIHGVGRRIGS